LSTARWLLICKWCVVVVLALSGATPASAQQAFSVGKFIAGGALGLAMHEGGHVAMDLALGASPGLRGVSFGPLPFFAITHDAVSPAREFAISSAGFWMQHASSELILTRAPGLRDRHAPVLTGVLAFNVLSSVAYAGAAFARVGPTERDTRGMAVSAGIDEPLVGLLVLTPAALDAARYFTRDAAWLRWTSRAVKVGGAMLIVLAASNE
jgi:hypothetical protein